MKILLINPPIHGSKNPSFPLGLAYIARVLRDKCYDISVLDINAHRWSQDEVKKKISSTNFDVVGITALITEYKYVKWLTKTIKEENPLSKVILGGGLASAVPEIVLKRTNTDIAVIGEGEVTTREVINSLEDNKNLNNVRGIMFKGSDKLHKTGPRVPIENLDEIPFPDRELFPMELYTKNVTLGRKLVDTQIRCTSMITSRGCPYNCIYCYKGIWGQKFRARSPENIIEEIEELIKRYKINYIFFVDDIFVLDKKRVYSFCDELVDRNVNISWECNGRVNLMDLDMLKKMRAAGCRIVSYGIESGNQEILDAMNKKVTVEQAKKAIQLTWEAGMLPKAYLMIGMFGEKKKSVRDTINFCKEVGPIVFGISFTTPLPSTTLYQKAKQAGKVYTEEELVEKWDGWGDKILVNLTEMPDEELRKLRDKAMNKIVVGVMTTKFWRYYKVMGLKTMLRNSFSLLRMKFQRKSRDSTNLFKE